MRVFERYTLSQPSCIYTTSSARCQWTLRWHCKMSEQLFSTSRVAAEYIQFHIDGVLQPLLKTTRTCSCFAMHFFFYYYIFSRWFVKLIRKRDAQYTPNLTLTVPTCTPSWCCRRCNTNLSTQLECLAGIAVMPNCMYQVPKLIFYFSFTREMYFTARWKWNEYDEWLGKDALGLVGVRVVLQCSHRGMNECICHLGGVNREI